MLITTTIPKFDHPVIILQEEKVQFRNGIPLEVTPVEMPWEKALEEFPNARLLEVAESPLTHFRSNERLVLVLGGAFALMDGGVALVRNGGYAAGYGKVHLSLASYSIGFGFLGATIMAEVYSTAIAVHAQILPPNNGDAYMFVTPESVPVPGHVYGVFDQSEGSFTSAFRKLRKNSAPIPPWPDQVFAGFLK
jgi:hypothetical protein